MKRMLWTGVVGLLVTLVGCGGGGGGATPRETFNRLKNALTDKKFEDVWDLISTESQKYFEDQAADIAKKAEQVERESESQSRIALENQARMMEIPIEKMKQLDGPALVAGLYRMAAKDDKDVWGTISRTKFSRDEVAPDGKTAKVFVELDGIVQEDSPIPMVREGDQWKLDALADLGKGK